MRDGYLRTSQVFGPVQEIPTASSRVTLADGVVDDLGRPVARLAGAQHAETVRTAEVIRARAEEWMHASGAEPGVDAPDRRRRSRPGSTRPARAGWATTPRRR